MPGISKEVRVLRRLSWFVAGALAGAAAPVLHGDSPERRAVNLPGRTVQAPFSDGVVAGDTLYIAGKIGLDPKTGKPPAEIEQEARLMIDGVKATLSEAGMTMDDLVMVQIHCPDLTLFDRFNAVYRSYFAKEFPARAFIGSGPLLFGGRFEMTGIAVKRR